MVTWHGGEGFSQRQKVRGKEGGGWVLGTEQPHPPILTFKKLAGSPCPAANGCLMPGRHTSAAGMALKSWLACKWAHSAHICRRVRHARFQMCMQQVHICNRMAIAAAAAARYCGGRDSSWATTGAGSAVYLRRTPISRVSSRTPSMQIFAYPPHGL